MDENHGKTGKKFFLIMLVFICLYRQSLTEYNAGLGLEDWVFVSALPLTNCVALGKSFLSGPWFPSW